ncbi:MAG: ethanolamine utilization protein EutJ [Alphaproteobacteria bacterium]|nr:ethanolamine utilization protein EutJ [Alphaproteobacteria bacterium]
MDRAPDIAGRAAGLLERAAERLRNPAPQREGLRFGVDLGTATIVLCVVDGEGEPVYWDFLPERAVRDGVVVDFRRAAQAVAQLRRRCEAALGVALESAAAAYPPGVPLADCQACRYVLEQAGIECRTLADEVSAAQALLGVSEGLIVDVGGGSTGVGRVRAGKLVSVSDRPGGGYHLDLILAGALGVSIEEAERCKRLEGHAHLNILRPGVERVAASIRQQSGDAGPHAVHLAGGALMLPGAAQVIEQYLGWPAVAYPQAHLVTPFGIALS